ncbi:DEKNAAC101826 [Brettanomyces naardenensis]|uniref:4-nitrophenylphosphatase n=1 Tax=Brettanomyces naardenensis TaxID=13370 RepID=A0A448YIX4_BRENA|nr:DEKNAAC101826 [Brettanomyces naardenensis]
MSVKIANRQQVIDLLDSYDNFLFDCDGVLWLDTLLLPKVLETLGMLRNHGKHLIFVTNNSTKSREQYVEKFAKFGLKVSKSEVFGSAYASAIYAKDILQLPTDKKVWVLGGKGLEVEFGELGYTTLGGTRMPELESPLNSNDPSDPINHLDPEVGAVAVGLDTHLNYHRLAITLQYLLRPDVAFIASNIDSTFPANGMILPGAGTVVQAVATCSHKTPVLCGKPNKGMMDAIVEAHHIDKSRSIMIGDRLNTDMKFGRDNGLASLLVLTGIESEDTLKALDEKEQPTYYATKLGDLYELLQKGN